MFWDGYVIYQTKDLKAIKTKNFKDVYNRLKSGLENIINSKTAKYFDNFCYILFRDRLLVPGDNTQGRLKTVVTLCFKDEEVDGIINRFKNDFLTRYVDKIGRHDEYFTMQMYKKLQPIEIQYFNSEMKFEKTSPIARRFYTSFTREGLVLLPDKVHTYIFNKKKETRPHSNPVFL